VAPQTIAYAAIRQNRRVALTSSRLDAMRQAFRDLSGGWLPFNYVGPIEQEILESAGYRFIRDDEWQTEQQIGAGLASLT
jgi:hypothetical protein